MNFFGFKLLFFIDFTLRIQDFRPVYDCLSVSIQRKNASVVVIWKIPTNFSIVFLYYHWGVLLQAVSEVCLFHDGRFLWNFFMPKHRLKWVFLFFLTVLQKLESSFELSLIQRFYVFLRFFLMDRGQSFVSR